MFRSKDAGATWSAVNNGVPVKILYWVVIDPTSPTTVYAAGNGGVIKSVNGGDTWSAVNTGLSTPPTAFVVTIDPSSHTTLYAGTDSGLFKTTDGGATWSGINSCSCRQRLGNFSFYTLVADPAAAGTLYAGGPNNLLVKSTNGGTTWGAANSGIDTGVIVNGLALDTTPGTVLHWHGQRRL